MIHPATPPLGSTVTVRWNDGVRITGEVEDTTEDGTGYVVADAMVYPDDQGPTGVHSVTIHHA